MARLIIAFLTVSLWCSSINADIYVIGHKDLPASSITSRDIASIYLLKKKQWPEEVDIKPVNLPPQSETRRLFTEKIFHRPPEKLGSYWNEMLFKGISPPIIQNSEAAVMMFVERVFGAVGYINNKPDSPNLKVLLHIKD